MRTWNLTKYYVYVYRLFMSFLPVISPDNQEFNVQHFNIIFMMFICILKLYWNAVIKCRSYRANCRLEQLKYDKSSVSEPQLLTGTLQAIRLNLCGSECVNEQSYENILSSLRLCAALVISGLEPCIWAPSRRDKYCMRATRLKRSEVAWRRDNITVCSSILLNGSTIFVRSRSTADSKHWEK